MNIIKRSRDRLAGFNKRTWTILAVIVLLSAGGGGYACYKLVYSAAATTVSAAPLQTTVVRRGNLVIYASGNGTLVAASEASFGFGTSGQVTKVNAKMGDLVKAGDVLAEIDNTDQQIQYIQAKRALTELTSPYAIATAQVNVATALQNVAAAKSRLEYLISPNVMYWEGQVAGAEQALADATTAAANSPSTAANDKVTKAAATLKYYQDKMSGAWYYYDSVYVPANFTSINRMTRVKTVAAPTEAEIANYRAALAQSQAAVVEEQNYLAVLQGETIPEDATGASLTTLENSKLALKTAEENLAGTQLIAPISGTLMTFDLTVGNQAGTTTTVTIADLSQPFIQVYLDSADWNTVKTGRDAEITFDTLPDSVFTGKVTQVDPGLYTSGNTSVIRALVQLDPADGFDLPLGSAAAVDVIGGRADNAMLIPIEALHPAGSQYTVFVMVNGRPTLRVVQIGIQDLVSVEVISGLQVGDVVTTGIAGTRTQ